MIKIINSNNSGVSMLGIILALGIYALLSSAIVSLMMGSFAGIMRSDQWIEGNSLAQEGYEAVRSIRDRAWNEVVLSKSAIATSTIGWIFSGEDTTEQIGDFTRTITFEDVCRNISDNIVTCPGEYLDIQSKKVDIKVVWPISAFDNGATSSAEYSSYLTNWEGSNWLQTDWSNADGQLVWSDESRFESADTNIFYSDTGELKLYTATEGGGWFPSGGFETTDTSDVDFGLGEFINTMSIRTGDASSVVLDDGYMWNEHSDSTITTVQGINDISAIGSSNIWAVTDNGGILNYNGISWVEHSNKGVGNLNSIEMVDSSDGWAVGDNWQVYRYDGGIDAWIYPFEVLAVSDDLISEFNQGNFTNTVAVSTVDGEVVLDQVLGWEEIPENGALITEDINSISAVNQNDIWAIGDGGKVLHYDGAIWEEHSDMGVSDIYDIDMVDLNEGWAVGANAKFYHYDGVSWSIVPGFGNDSIYSVEMISANEGWVTGQSSKIFKYDGVSWTEFDDLGNVRIYDIDIVDSSNIWAAADMGRIYHYDGVSWSLFLDTGNTSWYKVDFIDASNGWMTGGGGKILYFDGVSWSEAIDTGNTDWYGLHMFDLNNGIAVGSGGQIQIWDGLFWTSVASPVSSILRGVVMNSNLDIWVVGDNGVIMNYGEHKLDSGVFESRIIDSQSASAVWGTASWTEVLPIGSDVTVSVRAGNTPAPDITWTGWSAELTNANGSSVPSVVGQYLQYRATFARGLSLIQSPSLHDVKVTFNESVSVDLNDISVVLTDNNWVVGDGGYIANYDGNDLVEVVSPVSVNINTIDMLDANEGWAAGDSGKILYYNGVTWSEYVDTGTMNWMALKMITSTNGWLVGSDGLIYNYNGVTWSQFLDAGAMTWNDISMLSSSLGWIVGNGGQIYQFDGAVWLPMTSPSALSLGAIEMISNIDGWVGGIGGTILNYKLSSYSSGTFLSQIFDGIEIDPGWGVVYWQENLPINSDITLFTRTGATPAPDASWTDWSAEMTNEVTSLVPANQNDRYLQYRATLALNSAISSPELDYVTITYAGATSFQLNDISVINSNDAWAVGNTGKIAHRDGSGWSLFVELGGSNLNGIDMVDSNNGWAVGQGGELNYYDGVSWTLAQDTGGDIWNAVDMIDAGDGWVVGNSGKILHYDGSAWTEFVDLGTKNLYDIFMLSTNEGWIVGDHGVIYYYNGVAWLLFDDVGVTDLYGIHMLSSGDGWIVGASGKTFHFNGVSWDPISTPTGQNLNDVYMFSSESALAVGDNGVILDWDGVAWSIVNNPNLDDLYAIDMFSTLGGWVVGFKGVVSIFREAENIVPPIGVLISSAFQMGTSTYPVEVIEWDEEIPETCSPISACAVKFEVRVALDNAGVPGVWMDWYGEDGPGTYFTERRGGLIPQELNWNSWIQYRVTLTSDEVVTPVLHEVRINYKD
ncbi:hypothetical protein ISS03_01410 [Patescibacteria group bacterium]|nr:hypothetical protein [Patescibacteria group bacterium]